MGMEARMISQNSVDGLLVGVLMRLHGMRFTKAQDRAVCVWHLKDCIVILCVMGAMIFLSWAHPVPHADASILMLFSLCLPWVFGWLTGIWILKHARVPDGEENGLIAARILDRTYDKSTNYMTTFLLLLYAVMDEDGPRAIELADELDAYGWDAHELTALVRSAFE